VCHQQKIELSHYHIRLGEARDMAELMRLINELAAYERAPEEVENTAAGLLDDWQQHKSFDFLVAEAEGRVVGMSLFYPRYSTWKGRCYYLEDLYVEPAFRGQGIGLALIQATTQEARNAGAARLDWQVLDWNHSAVRLYEQLGAVIEKEWWNCKWQLSEP
jgi:GNAT superfamily N-acetyltransferase